MDKTATSSQVNAFPGFAELKDEIRVRVVVYPVSVT